MSEASSSVVQRDTSWLRAAQWARWLAWASLAWMTVEGAVGLVAGFQANSIALVGWALSSVVEGLASVIVIWRFTGARTLSETAEARAQKAVAISFWLLAPYVAIESIRNLIAREMPKTTLLGIGLTISSLLLMPALGVAKQRLGNRLSSGATAGEGTQNLLCAYLAGAVLVGLVGNSLWGWWWLDPVAGVLVAAVAIKEGRDAWRGDNCAPCRPSPPSRLVHVGPAALMPAAPPKTASAARRFWAQLQFPSSSPPLKKASPTRREPLSGLSASTGPTTRSSG